jgi:hypothetical protein
MPTAAQVTRVIPLKPEPWITTGYSSDKVSFENCPAGPRKNTSDDDDEDTLK